MAKAVVAKSEKEFLGTKKEWVVGKSPIPIAEGHGYYDGACDIVAKDEKGYYFTHSRDVDSGLLDTHRIYNRIVPIEEIIQIILNPPKVEVVEVVVGAGGDGTVTPAEAITAVLEAPVQGEVEKLVKLAEDLCVQKYLQEQEKVTVAEQEEFDAEIYN